MKDNIYFKVKTPLYKEIRITKEYWNFVKTVKHPNMEGKEKEIIKTLKDPEFIRKSNKDERVYLYLQEYRQPLYLCCLQAFKWGGIYYNNIYNRSIKRR